ncbi:DNA-binding transcriptional regulator [uncultured Shewanella sp.]|uniref:helix-turn-helix domain-containing protein n=1 Tax=uncultured Shewanella sp. TaxID=173975 RepID=UPI002605FDC6|nr:helix-turn-helix domain-containing protein [uncultured Shewanella sp.]
MRELEKIRTSFDLTEAKLAEIMNVSEAEVQQWQAGEGQPSIGKMFKLLGFIAKNYGRYFNQAAEDEYQLDREPAFEQLQFNPACEENAPIAELSQEDNEKVRNKLNQVTSATNMLLLATDENELHHGTLSLMSDTLWDMKQILKS